MILHSIKLHNFGIYAGDISFDLKPENDGQFYRPIILFRGQNGVGKSTLVEAIRLCLHGRLSLGSRVIQRDYETYLKRRLHRTASGDILPNAFIQLDFEHVYLGRRQVYRVIRSWGLHKNHIVQEVNLWIDDAAYLAEEDEKEHLLRELIPPGVAELFFFDGEKITTLSETGEASDALLAETVKNLLGLHLVEQLDKDLDIYLTRQSGIQEMQQFQTELAQLHDEEADLGRQRAEVQDMLADCRHHLLAKREAISLLEERISREGGTYAQQKDARNEDRNRLAEAIAQVEQEIYELSRGLVPFAMAPRLLQSVRDRLLQEAEYERWQAAQPVLKEIETRLVRETTAETYSVGADTDLNEELLPTTDKEHIRRVFQAYEIPPIPETAVVHRVSAETRGVLLSWINEALVDAPQKLVLALQKRQKLQQELAATKEALDRIPSMQILEPLQAELRQHYRDLGRFEAEQDRLVAEDKRLTYHLERIAGSKRRVAEQISGITTDEQRIKLAARTKLLLDQYQKKLMTGKLTYLGIQLTKRFNQLSRKRNFIERVRIDPETFHVTLYRGGQPFPRRQLSAGEDQVFAVATLWALREVSGRPLPVIIDTPLSRLDDVHRRTMLAEFMPQVAQQVIVLATTTEIDDQTFTFLQPAVSRAYLLQADSTTTQVSEQPIAKQPSLISLEEVSLHAAE